MPLRRSLPELATVRTRVLVLVGLLMFLAGLFTAMDLDRTWQAVAGITPYDEWPELQVRLSAVLRMLRSVLCLLLVLQVGPGMRLRPNDDAMLTGAFVLAVTGDAFLIFREGHPQWFFLAGVGAFLLCHLLLTVRHLQGISDDLDRPGVRRGLVVSGVVVLGLSVGVVAAARAVMKPVLDSVYVGVLGLSLWAAVGAAIRADDTDFPSANRLLIAGGLALFWLCDISLGVAARMTAAEGHTPMALWIGMVPDLTYSWALIALALSGFRWDVLTGRPRDYSKTT